MDGGAIQRTTPAPSAAPVRSDSVPARPSAPTVAAPAKVVQPVGESSAVEFDVSRSRQRLAEALTQVERQQTFDKDAGDVVVSWVDHDTGDVVHQFPTEQMLQLRAYWRDKLRETDQARSAGARSADILI